MSRRIIVSLRGGEALFWRNTPDPCFLSGSIGGATYVIPTIPLHFTTIYASALIEGVDFTSVGSNTLFSNLGAGGQLVLKNCKLGTGPIIGAPTSTETPIVIDVVNCDSWHGDLSQ